MTVSLTQEDLTANSTSSGPSAKQLLSEKKQGNIVRKENKSIILCYFKVDWFTYLSFYSKKLYCNRSKSLESCNSFVSL